VKSAAWGFPCAALPVYIRGSQGVYMRRVVVAAFLSGLAVLAQVNKSNLTGIVRDSSGGAIEGAALRLINTGTGAIRQEVTSAAGLYRFTLLDHGRYRLEAEHPGFKKSTRDGIQLETGETVSVDVELEVGQLADSVTVTGEASLLRTETGALGTTVDRRMMNEMPLIGRNPYVFLALSPGIQYYGSPGALNPWDVFGPADFAASGSEARSEFLLDGIPNMRIDVVSFSPSPDAVQEMRVQTNTYDAEYGHSGAAFVNVSTRSGTNDVHGSVYLYHRNDNLNANSFFNNRNNRNKTENKLNTYGFTLSGPAYIPKLYDGRDRTHYFFDFEGTQSRGESRATAIVPTALERAGDFSQTRDRTGNLFTIYDPGTTRPSGSGFVRDAFRGNLIPAAQQDRVAVNALKFYPAPNRPATQDLQNFENARPNSRKWASLAGRADHQLSSSHSLFFRYGWNHRSDPSSPYYGECCRPAGNPTDGQDEFARGNIAAAASYTWIQSPRTVIDFRLGYTRYFDANIMYGEGFDAATLGFPASFARSVSFLTFPRFEMRNGDVENLGAGRVTSRVFIDQYNPLVNIHTNTGRHALKFGFRYQLALQNNFGPGRAGGQFQFGRQFTQGPDPTRTTATGGHNFAAFLLGMPDSAQTEINASRALQNTFYALYLQDDWKATNRLTLNVGLRFEHEAAPTERFNRANGGYDFTLASPIEAAAQANYRAGPIPELPASAFQVKGGLTFLNVNNAPRGSLRMPAAIYSPRVGYAYRLTNWLVWRGGWGMFYTPNNVGNLRQDGFSLSTRMITSLDNNLTPFHRLADPFPSGLTPPPGASGGLLTAVGQGLTAGAAAGGTIPAYLHGFSQQFSMGFQFVLPGNFSVETSYVGNISQRLTMSRNVNQYPDAFLPLRTRLNASVSNPFFGVITDRASSLSQRTAPVSQLLRPFPHFTGLTRAVLPFGRSHYDSMQLQVRKRFAAGLSFGAAYTISKYIEGTSYLNANDAKPERVISDSDRPQRLVVGGLYELPFGPGKKLLGSTNPVLSRLAGGWQASWVVTFNSMAPLAFSGAERLRRSDRNPHTVDEWFDPRQFVPREPFTLAALSSRVADLRAPGINKWDISVIKTVPVRERVAMKLSAELYNAWNTTHFGTPNTTVTARTFGQISGTFLGPREIQVAARVEF